MRLLRGGEEGEGEVEEGFGGVVGDEEVGEGRVGREAVGVVWFGGVVFVLVCGGGGGGGGGGVDAGGRRRRFQGTEVGVTIVLEA